MGKFARASFLGLLVGLALTFGQRASHAQEVRFALVIGNDGYKAAKLATPANDAGLVADALQSAGFTVTGARNLDQTMLRETFREFLGQVSAAGPDAVALVYLAGIGLQFEGDNYFVPVDADIQRDVDVPLQAIRISDFTQLIAALPGRVKIVILDAARQNPFARGGQPLASGLALVDPAPNTAIAFNAAPGTVAPDEPGPYGAYATSLTEMIASGGLSLDDLFARVRLRVSDLTRGAEVPWYASQINGPFFLTERAADAPPPPNVTPFADIRDKPLRDFVSVHEAYTAALARDTMDGYEQFLAMYPNGRFSRRVAAMLAVRREEIIWRRCVRDDTPPAYWSYMRRYPHGPHVWDAQRRLTMLGVGINPAPDFASIDFGVPPPPPDELVLVDRPILMFEGPGFLPPPPPPPLFFLPPRPREFAVLPPPPPPRERFFLPTPGATTVPAFVRPPRTVTLPPAPSGQGGAPSGRPTTPISLPAAVSRGTPEEHGGRPGEPGVAAPGIVAPLPTPGRPGGPPPPPPPAAFVKPAPPPPPPPHPQGAAPTSVKPVPPPPPPGPPVPATVKPAPPPPPHPGPAPASVKPSPPPPSPPRPGPAPASVKPSPPPPSPPHAASPPRPAAPVAAKPPPPPPPNPTVKPARCPPGKKPTPAGCK